MILCKVPDKFETEVVEKCHGDYEYAVTDKESAVMWRLKYFDGDPVQGTDSSITKIVERLQKEKSDVDVSEVRTRTVMVKLRNRKTGASFLAVSWHGPWRPSKVITPIKREHYVNSKGLINDNRNRWRAHGTDVLPTRVRSANNRWVQCK